MLLADLLELVHRGRHATHRANGRADHHCLLDEVLSDSLPITSQCGIDDVPLALVLGLKRVREDVVQILLEHFRCKLIDLGELPNSGGGGCLILGAENRLDDRGSPARQGLGDDVAKKSLGHVFGSRLTNAPGVRFSGAHSVLCAHRRAGRSKGCLRIRRAILLGLGDNRPGPKCGACQPLAN